MCNLQFRPAHAGMILIGEFARKKANLAEIIVFVMDDD